MIELTNLNGTTMHLNEDLIERVESGVEGQCAVYVRDGGHFVVANRASDVVSRIRDEKVEMWRRALQGDGGGGPAKVTKLSEVRGQ